MKKKADWITKAEKRKAKKKDRGIVDVLMLMHHFFKDLPQWLNEMEDPRNFLYHIYSDGPDDDGAPKKFMRGKKHAFDGRSFQ